MMLLHYIVALILIAAEDVRHVSSFNRIVGGYLADIESFPFIVSLQSNGEHGCGGAIITPSFIVTAAHCVHLESTTFIKAGTDDLEKHGVTIKVEDSIVHPKYNPVTLDFDVALLKLKKPLTYTNRIQNIKLPEYSSQIRIRDGTVMGWGWTNNPNDNLNHLRALDMEIYNVCEEFSITTSMFCAKHLDGRKDICANDSGGPFVKDGILYGIVSFGTDGCGIGAPAGFAKVSYVVKWIKKHIKN